MFITAIKAGTTKLGKYFPRRLTGNSLILYKPYILAIVLDPRFKTALFREGRQLCFTATTESDVVRLLKAEFIQ
jgi:hypothetical protein